MKSENIGVVVFKTVLIDTIWGILRFPVWWYTKGLAGAWSSFLYGVKTADETLGVSIWVKNILKPMYGQYDIVGRFISIIIRCIQIVARASLLLIWLSFLVIKLVLWLVLPVIVASQIGYQLTGRF